jgi:hypothetical protein
MEHDGPSVTKKGALQVTEHARPSLSNSNHVTIRDHVVIRNHVMIRWNVIYFRSDGIDITITTIFNLGV